MKKIIALEDHFPTGESTLQPVMLYGPGGNRQDLSHITKTASEALDYIKNVNPEPGKTHLLALAMGSTEAYGPNRNGDSFTERPVLAPNGKDHWVAPGEELTKHYKTFETNPAHAFLHHVNKDPAKASGHVKKAFWNQKMSRVELLICIDNAKDPEWVQRVNDGDFPAVSMGCRIKYDVCSICGNKAPTRAQYCDHAKFQMNQVLPDGRKVSVHNPSPNFFDISRVFRPADRTGYTLKKVAYVHEVSSSAELGDMVDSAERKSAAIRKVSDIDKVIRGEPVASASNLSPKEQALIRNFKDYAGDRLRASPDLPMDELHKHSAATVLSTLGSMGIVLKDAEFLEFVGSKLAGAPLNLSAAYLEKISALMPSVYDLFESSPSLCGEVFDSGVLDERIEKISGDLAAALRPYMTKRAYVGEMLYRRMVPEGMGLRENAAPTTDVLHYSDPHTGLRHATTRGAALDAQDATTRAHMRKVVGGSALLLGGYKALTAVPSLRSLKIPLGAGAAYLGYKGLKDRPAGEVMTDEGIKIPTVTEFAPKTGSDNTITALVVNLIESSCKSLQGKYASFGADVVRRVKLGGMVDSVKGLELDFEIAAAELGQLICS